jgi:hypothetical protein
MIVRAWMATVATKTKMGIDRPPLNTTTLSTTSFPRRGKATLRMDGGNPVNSQKKFGNVLGWPPSVRSTAAR